MPPLKKKASIAKKKPLRKLIRTVKGTAPRTMTSKVPRTVAMTPKVTRARVQAANNTVTIAVSSAKAHGLRARPLNESGPRVVTAKPRTATVKPRTSTVKPRTTTTKQSTALPKTPTAKGVRTLVNKKTPENATVSNVGPVRLAGGALVPDLHSAIVASNFGTLATVREQLKAANQERIETARALIVAEKRKVLSARDCIAANKCAIDINGSNNTIVFDGISSVFPGAKGAIKSVKITTNGSLKYIKVKSSAGLLKTTKKITVLPVKLSAVAFKRTVKNTEIITKTPVEKEKETEERRKTMKAIRDYSRLVALNPARGVTFADGTTVFGSDKRDPEEDVCFVCQDTREDVRAKNSCVEYLACAHWLCMFCYIDLIEHHDPFCPLCRTPFFRDSLTKGTNLLFQM